MNKRSLSQHARRPESPVGVAAKVWLRERMVSGLLVVGTFIAAGGCTSWAAWEPRGEQSAPSVARKLPLRKLGRSIELETEFVQIHFDPTDPDKLASMWQWVDETVLPRETRQRLLSNGLRIGKVTHQERLSRQLEQLKSSRPEDVVGQFLSSAMISSRQSEGKKTERMRIGKRYELPVCDPIAGNHVVIIHDEPQPIGRTLRDPQFIFAILPERGDSSAEIKLRLRPEIQHGEMRQDWVQGDAALRIDVRRQSWSLESMETILAGGEGDLFVVSETTQRKGIGKAMLGGKNVDQLEEQTVLLIRIANVPTPAEQL